MSVSMLESGTAIAHLSRWAGGSRLNDSQTLGPDRCEVQLKISILGIRLGASAPAGRKGLVDGLVQFQQKLQRAVSACAVQLLGKNLQALAGLRKLARQQHFPVIFVLEQPGKLSA